MKGLKVSQDLQSALDQQLEVHGWPSQQVIIQHSSNSRRVALRGSYSHWKL